jgi:hypothetical protein
LVVLAPDAPGVASGFGLKLKIFHPKIPAVKGSMIEWSKMVQVQFTMENSV